MENTRKNKELEDIKKIKNFLLKLGFICDSSPSSQNLIYSKDGEVIMIKNRRSKRGEK
jgi:hypothetical protein